MDTASNFNETTIAWFNSLGESSKKSYSRRISQFLAFCEKNSQIIDWVEKVKGFLIEMYDSGLTATTINSINSILTSYIMNEHNYNISLQNQTIINLIKNWIKKQVVKKAEVSNFSNPPLIY